MNVLGLVTFDVKANICFQVRIRHQTGSYGHEYRQEKEEAENEEEEQQDEEDEGDDHEEGNREEGAEDKDRQEENHAARGRGEDFETLARPSSWT